MKPFDHVAIEKKWQERWERDKLYRASDNDPRKKFYALVEFPYPSGEGLHVGHPRSYTAMDVIARKRRMEGYNVLFPIGWDAFGLPAENYAIKTGIHPKITTQENIETFRRQLKALGLSFDWSREINTADPSYYHWTQWIFLQLFSRGLAYKTLTDINWCTSCNVGLANEEVVGGRCERCGGVVVRRARSQWMLRITAYAQRLLDDLETVDFPSRVKKQQIDWIGRSEGALIRFPVAGTQISIETFTTRPDTLFGATFLVLAPEHEAISSLKSKIENFKEVTAYVQKAKKAEVKRKDAEKEKGGVVLKGVEATNPATGEKIPIWVSDYVMTAYGTGAIMAVPAHDERDLTFARMFGLPVRTVIKPEGKAPDIEAYEGHGTIVNSGKFDEMSSREAAEVMAKEYGKVTVRYKLRDWVFSRQRYWGEPIPLVFCAHCEAQSRMIADQDADKRGHQAQISADVETDKRGLGENISVNPRGNPRESALFTKGELLNPGWVAVPEDQLPVTLPELEKFRTTETGDSPLTLVPEWVNTTCPRCGGPAQRETDTMPQWAGSSWYWLRYTDPRNDSALADKKKLEYWTCRSPARSGQCEGGVDWYNGGMEHTTLHLLYSRFWHKVLWDVGAVPTPEPYAKRTSHGLILGEGGAKMSKSRGNVINPDDMVKKFGADAFRVYEMFMGPFEEAIPWSMEGIRGAQRFLERTWKTRELVDESVPSPEATRLLHATVKKVSDDIESMNFNTAVSSLMIMLNTMERWKKIPKEVFETYLMLLSPFAPHCAEELWEELGHTTSIFAKQWPAYDPALVKGPTVTIAVQISGKTRGTIKTKRGASQDEVLSLVKNDERLGRYVVSGIENVVFVKDRIINLIVTASV